MSKSWTEEELKIASEQMKKNGNLSYEEFVEELNKESNINEEKRITNNDK